MNKIQMSISGMYKGSNCCGDEDGGREGGWKRRYR